ncbi:MAG: hypothetical protein ACR2J8_15205, partial [Thermomicrobiales bacterium]
QEPERPASPYLPPPVPAAQPSWFDHLLPGAGVLKIATGFVGLALLATVAGDAIMPDPAPRQSIAMNSAQVATSILPSAAKQAPAAAPAANPAGVTETPAPALQQTGEVPATLAANSAPSPWRIAQLALGLLLLWLLVSLAGRLWVDRHENLPG